MSDLLLPQEEIRELVQTRGVRAVADTLFRMGVPFEDAYKAIFGREPKLDIDLDFS